MNIDSEVLAGKFAKPLLEEFREIFKRGEANFLRHGSYTLALAFFQHSSGHLKAYFFQVYVG